MPFEPYLRQPVINFNLQICSTMGKEYIIEAMGTKF